MNIYYVIYCLTLSTYTNKQKSVYKGYISIYVPSIDIIIMCMIISHTGISVIKIEQ